MTLSKLLKHTRSTGLLLVFYSVGVLGLCSLYQQQVLTLTPCMLLAAAGLLFAHYKPWRWSLAGFCGAAWAISFWVEVVGVHTGWVFGPYRYGAHLGWQLWGVPVLIGLNWVVLVYAAGNMVKPLAVSRHPKCLALLVVLVDWLVEPVAVRLGFWQWTGGGYSSTKLCGLVYVGLRTPRAILPARQAPCQPDGACCVCCLVGVFWGTWPAALVKKVC